MVWKKGESDEAVKTGVDQAGPRPRAAAEPRHGQGQVSKRAVIGPSITVKGDISGDEDLYIEGRVEGTVELKKHQVTIGAEGRVKADVQARTVTVDGEMEGELHGGEQVILRASARVRGNIVAPRVTLEDGANFRGSIDMQDAEPAQAPRPVPPQRPAGAQASPGTTPAGGSGSVAAGKPGASEPGS